MVPPLSEDTSQPPARSEKTMRQPDSQAPRGFRMHPREGPLVNKTALAPVSLLHGHVITHLSTPQVRLVRLLFAGTSFAFRVASLIVFTSCRGLSTALRLFLLSSGFWPGSFLALLMLSTFSSPLLRFPRTSCVFPAVSSVVDCSRVGAILVVRFGDAGFSFSFCCLL